MDLFGTWHKGTTSEINAVADLLAASIAKSKSDTVTIALEPHQKWIKRVPFDGEHLPTVVSLKEAVYSRRNVFGDKKIKFVGLDTSKGDSIGAKTARSAFFVDPRHTQKGEYVMVNSRTKFMAKSIMRIKPDIVLVGGVHALLLGPLLKVKPHFIQATRAEMLAYYRAERKSYAWVAKERIARRRARKFKLVSKKVK